MKIEFEITIDDRLAALYRKVFRVKTIAFLVAAGLFPAGLFIFSGEFDVVHTFEPYDIIRSSEVNQNFRNLAERTLGSISDVNADGAATGQVLKYNESTSTWELAEDQGGGDGTGLWSEGSSGAIYYNLGNVGIGMNTPATALDVAVLMNYLSCFMPIGNVKIWIFYQSFLSIKKTYSSLSLKIIV